MSDQLKRYLLTHTRYEYFVVEATSEEEARAKWEAGEGKLLEGELLLEKITVKRTWAA